jgi:hypothetical protein
MRQFNVTAREAEDAKVSQTRSGLAVRFEIDSGGNADRVFHWSYP